MIATALVAAAIAIGSASAAPTLSKRDNTSAQTEIFGYTDGRTVHSRCPNGTVPATYTSNTQGGCTRNAADCGKYIYAYLGTGSDGNPHHTMGNTRIVDICPPGIPSNESLGLTLASFKQLGGTATGNPIKNVNWKFVTPTNSTTPPTSTSGDNTSPVTEIFGYTDGRTVYSRCPNGTVPATYTSNTQGGCTRNSADCGKYIYAYLGSGTDGNPHHTSGNTRIVDICPPGIPSNENLGLTLASFKQLGGTATGNPLQNVNWKFVNATTVTSTPAPSADNTSPVTEVFGYTDGRTVYSRCPAGSGAPKTYTSNGNGACTKSAANCGKKVYAYLGNGHDGNPHHTEGTTLVVDICPPGSPATETLGLTYNSFKQLGGTLQAGKLTNVNWKFL